MSFLQENYSSFNLDCENDLNKFDFPTISEETSENCERKCSQTYFGEPCLNDDFQDYNCNAILNPPTERNTWQKVLGKAEECSKALWNHGFTNAEISTKNTSQMEEEKDFSQFSSTTTYETSSKIEEEFTNPPSSVSEPSPFTSTSESPKKKTAQNPFKNAGVLVMNKAIAISKDACEKSFEEATELGKCVQSYLSFYDIEQSYFLTFLSKFDFKTSKTFSIIKDNFDRLIQTDSQYQPNKICVGILMQCLKAFLSEEGEQEFDNWVRNSHKMNRKVYEGSSKEILKRVNNNLREYYI